MSPGVGLRRAGRAAVAALLLLAPASATASFTLRSEVDARKIGVQDQVQLTITVEGSGAPDEIALPALTNQMSSEFACTSGSSVGLTIRILMLWLPPSRTRLFRTCRASKSFQTLCKSEFAK